MSAHHSLEPCGCYYILPDPLPTPVYLPQVDLKVHSTILASTSRTSLSQTFINPSTEKIKNASYTFPLFDGVSIVSFKCEIGDRVIHGVVKEKEQARAEYDAAVDQGSSAALLEQSMSASDTFTTSIGNIPEQSKVTVHITYLGELQHDAQADGLRFTVPLAICPRYGKLVETPRNLEDGVKHLASRGSIEITVDVQVEQKSVIQRLQSPSHPLDVLPGRTSTDSEGEHHANKASASWALRRSSRPSQNGHIALERDFVLIVNTKDQGLPYAFLETHPTIPNQRAIRTSLVPKFNIPNNDPEIVFIIDRSGSMSDKIDTLKSALKVFLKSLPVGIKFNICSFGSSYSFLWKKSRTYDKSSLEDALAFVDTVCADFGGTEMLRPIKATVENRFQDLDLDVLLLTDGEIWDQEQLFAYINESVSKAPTRFFSLGIGDAVSHSLVQGIARAGGGFAQTVGTNEDLDKKVVRMLKAALTPHVKYTLELKYESSDNDSRREDDGFEIVEKSEDHRFEGETGPQGTTHDDTTAKAQQDQPPISLYDENFKETDIKSVADLPTIPAPAVIQAPYDVPGLFPFNRSTVYLLLSPESNAANPKSVILKGMSKHGPLSLTIPVEDVSKNITIHQLAARKIIVDLEEGRGWTSQAKDKTGRRFVDQHESKKEDIAKREAIRLGTKYQIAGKWCSFVAVESTEHEVANLTGKERLLSREPAEPVQYSQYAFGFGAPAQPMAWGIPPQPSLSQPLACSRKLKKAYPQPSVAAQKVVSRRGLFRSSPNVASTPNAFGAFQSQPPPAPVESAEISSVPSGSSPGHSILFGSPAIASFGSGPSFDPTEAPVSAQYPKFHQLILCQSFEGSWEWKRQIFDIIETDSETLKGKVDWSMTLGIGQDDIDKEDENLQTIVMTLAAIAYLNKKWGGDRETWELVGEKAMNWVNAKLAAMGGQPLESQQAVLDRFQSAI
ncbi:hypothetical protein D8B26_004966 [Coccidioides posadasii str. Silveira]|uniref:Uncharacterized protein n=1 Tax=Coccidioides posadasii (strain RMSCC 757 / Silveira) TaxID=443226 RepID=E9D5C2_COCPS|nr:conserved hypothetical protein [Coccidioides posadasii str. Silveira]QVM10306.1 hypothetical protein D8B26_004966 [Coccidioides posadasii str. Silveira]